MGKEQDGDEQAAWVMSVLYVELQPAVHKERRG